MFGKITKQTQNLIIVFISLFVLVSLSSCASFAQKTKAYRMDTERGNYDLALAGLEKNKDINNNKNRVLFLMDKGMILHLSGRYKESNMAFEAAEKQADEYWATSLTEEALSMVTSDDYKVYPGEDFERAMIHVYRALNYLMMNNLEDALVECRQLDVKLLEINRKYKKKNVYREDAFARWLSGILYEADGDMNNALIAYRRAIGIYEKDYQPNYGVTTPPQLIKDYIRALKSEGFDEELEKATKKFSALMQIKPLDKQMGEIVFIHQNGRSPYKVERFIVIPIKNTVVKVAFPEYHRSHYRIGNVRLNAANKKATGRIAEDITDIAIKNLKDRAGRMMLKTTARAATKYALKKAADKAHPLLGLAANIASVATEKADTRSWLSLPAEFNIARLPLKPGKHTLVIEYLTGGGAVFKAEKIPIEIIPGKKVFITRRTWY